MGREQRVFSESMMSIVTGPFAARRVCRVISLKKKKNADGGAAQCLHVALLSSPTNVDRSLLFYCWLNHEQYVIEYLNIFEAVNY